jgi:hypothetical protein
MGQYALSGHLAHAASAVAAKKPPLHLQSAAVVDPGKADALALHATATPLVHTTSAGHGTQRVPPLR